jgi:hypothetical protein
MTNKNTYPEQEDEISKALRDPERITQIMQQGIREALLKHKQAGNPVCVWRDNKVVWIPPELI